jgi:hypothetical protein
LLPHVPDHLNSPGRCFWMGWWGYAQREELGGPLGASWAVCAAYWPVLGPY